MLLYNTATRKKEEFTPLHSGKVGMYTCGPTVYGKAHIGNLKAFLTADVLRRHLTRLGYEVRHIKNITDVGHLTQDDISQGDSGEDKISKKAREEKKTPDEIARFYENYFYEAEKKVNILPAHFFPRATAHISAMIRMIEKIIAAGRAYEANGNIFFAVAAMPGYGALSGNSLAKLKVGARLEEHPDKKNPWDFALWLKADTKHLMQWDSPWSRGYPGWHIECSAMAAEYLGDTIDIHTGGEDHIFPHHEAEIAQSESATGKPFSRFWVHTRHMMMDGVKMSKSKGNILTIEDISEKGYSGAVLRLVLLSAHYRSQMNFTWDAAAQAAENLRRITAFVRLLEKVSREDAGDKKKDAAKEAVHLYEKKFWDAMNDDLNTPLALSALYEMITSVHIAAGKNEITSQGAKKILAVFSQMNEVLGLELSAEEALPDTVARLVKEREAARRRKDFKKSDELRAAIAKKGYIIEDTESGTGIRTSL